MTKRPGNPGILKIALSIGFLLAGGTGAATLQFSFVSDLGDFVGGGQTFSLNYDTTRGSTLVARIHRNPANEQYDQITLFADKSVAGLASSMASLMFGTRQLGENINIGTYLEAERYAWETAGHPGLSISFQNRGANMVNGQFTITELQYDPVRFLVESFTATFEQHADGRTPDLTGSVRYSLAGVPEPSTAGLLLLGLSWFRLRTRRRA